MGRRDYQCRVCLPCDDCDTQPTTLIAHVRYPSGGGVIVKPDVTTTCTMPPADRRLERVRITNPGAGYTVPPTVTLEGDGGTISHKSVWIRGQLDSVAVVDGGSGYSYAPSVTIANPGIGGFIKQAQANAVVEGAVVGVTLESQGIGYSSPPNITIAGGSGAQVSATMSGYVSDIRITKTGQGYTSPPSVKIAGGGGSGASAVAAISTAIGTIESVVLTAAGSGYSSPPTVTISGGGGEGAEAVAQVLYKVQSLSLTNGGHGYPPSPEVRIESDGSGGGASATATIDGRVVRVDVAEPGLYSVRSDISGNLFWDWPAVTIQGNATVSPAFSGGVYRVDGFLESYASAPSVSFSGGGGSGAAGTAELNWEQEHDNTGEFVNCQAVIDSAVLGMDVAPFQQPGLDTRAERLEWTVRAVSSNQAVYDPAMLGQLSHFLPGEAIWVSILSDWGTQYYFQRTVTYFVQRFFSRVEPDVVYRLGVPFQDEADNCTLTPTWRQYVDAKGDSFWHVESLALTDPGSNLFVPPDQTYFELHADGNAQHEIREPIITFNRAAPVVVAEQLGDFSVQPQLAISVVPAASEGWYLVDGVSVIDGGQTLLEDGTIAISLVLQAGHYATANGSYRLTGVVAGGVLQSVAIVSSDLLVGPATIASLELPADWDDLLPNRHVVGRSLFKTSTSHSQPTVSASCEPTAEGGVAATLTPNLVEDTDGNGRPVWRVQSVSVSEPGSGYQLGGGEPVLFEVQSPGIESFPAVGEAVTARDKPTVIATEWSVVGSGASLEVVLEEQETPQGDKEWFVSAVNIIDPGGGYGNFDLFLLEEAPGPAARYGSGFAHVSVNEFGQIVGVTVTNNGPFWVFTDRLHRVKMYSVGEYFERTITETSEPLPAISCIGEVSEANGWEKNVREFIPNSFFEIGSQVEVGDDFTIYSVDRTRQCALPEITVELE